MSTFLLYQQAATEKPHSKVPTVLLVSGVVRTLACGGWMFITSSDDHDAHDFFMILYIVCNIPWMYSCIVLTNVTNSRAKKARYLACASFFGAIFPLVYFFIQHKVHRVAGAYTRYSFFEWGLILCDVWFDSIMESDFRHTQLYLFGASDAMGTKILSQTLLDREDLRENRSLDQASPRIVDATLPNLISSQWKVQLEFASDLYTAFVFWSVFTSLIPSLFWFSVWELGIAGHELALLTCLSPIIFAIPKTLGWAQSRWGSSALFAATMLGQLAYYVRRPLSRLLTVSAANAAVFLHQTAYWSQPENTNTLYPGAITALGLLLSSLCKHLNYSVNPIWPFADLQSSKLNKFGLILSLLTLLERHTRTDRQHASKVIRSTPFGLKDYFCTSLPIGGLLFTLHSLMSDCSTLVAWTWTGYSHYQPKGPLPHIHGPLILIAQCLGLLIATMFAAPTSSPSPLLHPAWLLFGVGSFTITYRYQDWLGFFGALGFCIFVFAASPSLLRRSWPANVSAQVYFFAMLTYCVLGLASVWTVAYAFVPAGHLLRERSDIVSILQLGSIALGFRFPKFRRLKTTVGIAPSARSQIRIIVTSIALSSLLATLYKRPSQLVRPYTSAPGVITTGIWTLHFGLNNLGRDSQRQLQKLIGDMKLDIVGLLETDLHRIVFGNRDLTRRVVEDLGYYVDIGPTGPKSHTWGAVLVSKFPIINSTHHLLPSPHGELAPAIEAVVDIHGTPVTVVVAHNGQEEDPLDRELQSTELARIMASSYPRPLIFLGYVVTKPLATRPNPYEILVTDGRVHDIDKDDRDRWCEYILYRGLYRTAYARVSRGTVTDTELQIGQFMLPRHGHDIVDDSEAARYRRSRKEDVPSYLWMPKQYYGKGVNRHFYHVFKTPLYYKLPEGAVV